MLEHRDFVPGILAESKANFWTGRQPDHTYETFGSAVAAAGDWIKTSGARILQIETVVLPNIWLEEDAEDVSLITASINRWHQFIRVWFDSELPPPYR
jgi:hypothetical protein